MIRVPNPVPNIASSKPQIKNAVPPNCGKHSQPMIPPTRNSTKNTPAKTIIGSVSGIFFNKDLLLFNVFSTSLKNTV